MTTQHSLQATLVPTPPTPVTARRRNQAIECWRCPVCEEVYDDEWHAERCCPAVEDPAEEDDALGADGAVCPVCQEQHYTHRDAADCCLWKRLPAAQRYRIADAVENGTEWAVAIAREEQRG